MRPAKITILFFLLLIIIFPIFSEEPEPEEKNRDLYLVVDKSLSMEDKIEVVKSYLKNELINEDNFKPGDTLTVISFYGDAERVIEYDVYESGKIVEFKNKISLIKANGKYTDIGNALDELKKVLADKENGERRKKFILITDGKQEARPESKYYSKDGSFNHEFLEGMKTIKKKGWQIMYIAIGPNSDTEPLVEESGGTYTEVSEDATEEEFKEKVKLQEYLNMNFDIVGTPKIKAVPAGGKSVLYFKVKSSGTKLAYGVTVEKIKLIVNEKEQKNLLNKTQYVFLEPNKVTDVELPIDLDLDLSSGKYKGELTFVYPGGPGFQPSVTDVNFRIKGFMENNPWILPILILLLLILIFLIILVIRMLGQYTSFRVIVAGVDLNKNKFRIKHGRIFYISDSEKGFEIGPQKSARSFAKISAFTKGIRLKAIDNDRFENPDKFPKNMLNNECRVKKVNGVFTKMEFMGK